MKIHEKAAHAAQAAAMAIAGSKLWFLGMTDDPGAPPQAVQDKLGDNFPGWIGFSRENATAPEEALWIRAGALGFHDGAVAFADLPGEIRLAYKVFHQVFNETSTALDAAEAAEIERDAADARALAAAERAQRPATEADLEGTPLEPFPDPMAPSEFASATPVVVTPAAAPAVADVAAGAPEPEAMSIAAIVPAPEEPAAPAAATPPEPPPVEAPATEDAAAAKKASKAKAGDEESV